MREILIKGGLVYSGEDKQEPEKKDIFIRGNKIGGFSFQRKSFNKSLSKEKIILDATGLIITPGFIEINGSLLYDRNLLRDLSGFFYLSRGITSVIYGSDGFSPFPLFYGSKMFLKEWGIMNDINIPSSDSLKDLSAYLSRFASINFGFLIGYLTLRNALSYSRTGDLSLGEMESISQIIKKNLKEGGLGIAFNLDKDYAEELSYDEILRVLAFSEINRKVLMFRGESAKNPLFHLNQLFKTIKNFSLNVEINCFQPSVLIGGEEYNKCIEKMEIESSKHNINFDIFPGNLFKVNILDVLPREFALKSCKDCKDSLLSLKKQKNVFKKFIDQINSNADFFKDATISFMPKPLKFLEGKTIKNFMENHSLDFGEAIFKIAILSDLKAELIIRFNGDNGALKKFLEHKRSILSLNYYNSDISDINLLKTFEFILSSGNLVNKLTELPAKKMGIMNRGVIKEGNFADLVIFKDFKPHYVFVNGTMVLKEGKLLPGNFPVGNFLKTKFEL